MKVMAPPTPEFGQHCLPCAPLRQDGRLCFEV